MYAHCKAYNEEYRTVLHKPYLWGMQWKSTIKSPASCCKQAVTLYNYNKSAIWTDVFFSAITPMGNWAQAALLLYVGFTFNPFLFLRMIWDLNLVYGSSSLATLYAVLNLIISDSSLLRFAAACRWNAVRRGATLSATHLSWHRTCLLGTLCFFNASIWNVNAPIAEAPSHTLATLFAINAMHNIDCFIMPEPQKLDKSFFAKGIYFGLFCRLWLWVRWGHLSRRCWVRIRHFTGDRGDRWWSGYHRRWCRVWGGPFRAGDSCSFSWRKNNCSSFWDECFKVVMSLEEEYRAQFHTWLIFFPHQGQSPSKAE